MPFISETQIARVQGAISSANAKAHRAYESAKEKELVQLAETIGGAALFGFVRGKMEADDGSWVIPGTTLDIEMVTGLVLTSVGAAGKMFKQADFLGKYNSDAMFLGGGILAHYAGQVFRKYGKSGTFSLVAGGPELIGCGPVGAQMGQGNSVPMNDVLRSALASI